MVFNEYTKLRIVFYYGKGYNAPAIAKALGQENLKASRQGVQKFLRRYLRTKTLARKAGSGRPLKISAEMKAVIEEQMQRDDETTAVQLHALLTSKVSL